MTKTNYKSVSDQIERNITRSSMKPALYQDLFPTHADFIYRNAFLMKKSKQASKFQSDPSSNCFTIDV